MVTRRSAGERVVPAGLVHNSQIAIRLSALVGLDRVDFVAPRSHVGRLPLVRVSRHVEMLEPVYPVVARGFQIFKQRGKVGR